MKKLLVLLLAGIMIFVFSGCNNEDIEAGPDSTDRLEVTDLGIDHEGKLSDNYIKGVFSEVFLPER